MTEKTGWPPGMLQDDDRRLSKWLANRIDSRKNAREAAQAIQDHQIANHRRVMALPIGRCVNDDCSQGRKPCPTPDECCQAEPTCWEVISAMVDRWRNVGAWLIVALFTGIVLWNWIDTPYWAYLVAGLAL